jgi:hypothetical protein
MSVHRDHVVATLHIAGAPRSPTEKCGHPFECGDAHHGACWEAADYSSADGQELAPLMAKSAHRGGSDRCSVCKPLRHQLQHRVTLHSGRSCVVGLEPFHPVLLTGNALDGAGVVGRPQVPTAVREVRRLRSESLVAYRAVRLVPEQVDSAELSPVQYSDRTPHGSTSRTCPRARRRA